MSSDRNDVLEQCMYGTVNSEPTPPEPEQLLARPLEQPDSPRCDQARRELYHRIRPDYMILRTNSGGCRQVQHGRDRRELKPRDPSDYLLQSSLNEKTALGLGTGASQGEQFMALSFVQGAAVLRRAGSVQPSMASGVCKLRGGTRLQLFDFGKCLDRNQTLRLDVWPEHICRTSWKWIMARKEV